MSSSTRAKMWPTHDELLAWWITYECDVLPHPTPLDYLTIMRRFYDMGCIAAHSKLHGEFEEFRKRFVGPGG